jgi:transcriptional regulator with XRE-family HTH domain
MPIKQPTSDYWGMLIRSLRVSQQLSQLQLAEVLGVDQTTISRWERGLSKPQYNLRKALHGLARDAGLATLGDLTNIVNFSPFPMILVDRSKEVIAASVSSGFKPGLTVAEQTPPEEQIFLQDFIDQLEASGFWTGVCAKFDYAFSTETECRRAVVIPITIRGQVFALTQKAW